MAAMTREELETLAVLLAEDGQASYQDLGFLLWNRPRRPTAETARVYGKRRADALVAAGALCRPAAGRVALTERGRIALALSMARDPALRSAFLDEGDGPQER